MADQAVTELIIDSSQAVAGASDYNQQLGKTVDASKQAAAATDDLGQKIDTTSTKLTTSARESAQLTRALAEQSTAVGGTAAASIAAAKETDRLALAQKGVTLAIASGTISAAQGTAELALLGGRQTLVSQTAAKLQAGLISGADAMALLRNSSVEAAVASDVLTAAHGRAHGSSLALREALVLLHETLSGNYKRAMGSATIEAQAMAGGAQNLLAYALNPLVIGVVGAAAAFATLTIAGLEFRKSFDAVTTAMKLTGDVSGLTRGQLEQLAQTQAASAGISVTAYRSIEAAILRTGTVGADNFAALAAASSALAQATGEDAPKIAEELTKAVTDPAKGVEELDKKYQLFTASQLREIDAAVKSGDVHKAGSLILADMAPRMAELTKQAQEQAGWVDKLKQGWANWFDLIGTIGKQRTLEQQLAVDQANLQGELAAQAHLVAVGRNEEAASMQKFIEQAKLTVNYDQQLVDAEKAKADQQAKDKSVDERQKGVDKLVASMQEELDKLDLQVAGFDKSKAKQLELKLAYDLQKAGIDNLTDSQKQQLIQAAAGQIAAQQNLDDLDAQKKAGEEWAKTLKHMQEVSDELQRQQEAAHHTIAEQILKLQEQSEQYEISARQKTIDVELTKAQETAQRAHTTVTEDETRAITDSVNHLYDLKDAHDAATKAAEQLKEQQKQLAREIDHTTNQIVDEGAKLFDDAFFGKSKDRWKTFLDDIGKMVEKFFSQMAAEALLRPIVQPIVAQVFGSGLGGLVSNAANGTAGVAAGAAGTGGASPASLLGSGFSLGNSFGGGIGGLSSSVSSYLFGTAGNGIQMGSGGLLTMGAGAPIGTETVIPATNGLIGSGGGIGGVSLGTIATGFGGIAGVAGGIMGLLNSSHQNALGIVSDVAQIGGGIAALGTAIGVFGVATGGWGLAIAAVAAIVGELFGNKHPEHPTGQAEAILNAKGGSTGNFVDFTTDHGNAAPLHDAVNQMLIPFATAVAQQFGADLTGTRLGILNNSGTTSFSTGKVGDNNPADQSQPLSQLFQFDQKDQASINDALTHVTLALIQMAAKVDDADLSVARFNIDINDTAANIQKALTFVTSFRASLDALNTGSGFDLSKSIIGKAQSDATALFGQIKDFLDTTTKLFPDGAQIKDAQAAIKNYVEILIGLRQPVDTSLTSMEAAAKTLRANIDALKPVFDQVGISAADAAKALSQGMAKLAAQENESLQQQLDAINRPYINSLKQIAAAETINLRDAVASGADTSKAVALSSAAAGQAMKDLTQDQLQEVIREFINTSGNAGILASAFGQLNKSTENAAAAVADSMATMVSAAADMARGLNQEADSIKATIESLLTGSLSILSPRDQLAEAQRQYSANPTGQGLQSLLQLAQPFFGGATQGYADFFRQNVGTLVQVGARDAAGAAMSPFFAASAAGGAGGLDIGAIGDAASAGFLSSLPHFDKGGMVPGRIGAPTLAVVHGGEKVTPANDNSGAAMLAKMDALIARVEALTGATVDGSNRVASAVKPSPSIHSTRKLGALRG